MKLQQFATGLLAIGLLTPGCQPEPISQEPLIPQISEPEEVTALRRADPYVFNTTLDLSLRLYALQTDPESSYSINQIPVTEQQLGDLRKDIALHTNPQTVEAYFQAYIQGSYQIANSLLTPKTEELPNGMPLLGLSTHTVHNGIQYQGVTNVFQHNSEIYVGTIEHVVAQETTEVEITLPDQTKVQIDPATFIDPLSENGKVDLAGLGDKYSHAQDNFVYAPAPSNLLKYIQENGITPLEIQNNDETIGNRCLLINGKTGKIIPTVNPILNKHIFPESYEKIRGGESGSGIACQDLTTGAYYLGGVVSHGYGTLVINTNPLVKN